MAANGLTLEVFTRQKVLLTEEASWAVLPGELGELGILPGHAPLVTTLSSGVLRYQRADGTGRRAAVHHGYAQVRSDKVTVLVEVAESGTEIDLERARQAEERAREELGRLAARHESSGERFLKWESKLQRALYRLRAGS